MNSSSLSKLSTIAWTIAALAILAIVADFMSINSGIVHVFFQGSVIALAIAGIFMVQKVRAAIDKAVHVTTAIDKGDFETRVIGITEGGRLRELHDSINNMVDRTDAFVRESQACLEYVARNEYFRKIAEKGMTGNFRRGAQIINNATDQMSAKVDNFATVADDFENTMKVVVQTVSSAATELQVTAQGMESTAHATSDQASAVAAASDDASSNVQTVASAAEELSASIAEISRQVATSTRIAGDAVSEVDGANQKIQGLAEAANKIGEVVALITDIADQTNLLALNATIEAARAGEAGKGFAVVASEVKNLATQTAKATEEISTHINGIQGATVEAVSAIKSIGGTINEINEIAAAIAAAVEEQGAATQEIARNVEQAAAGTNQVSANIGSVTEAASETGAAAGEVLSAASELSVQSEKLSGEMDSFVIEMRKVV